MAIRRRGDQWQADFYDPSGKRIRQNFPTKKEAEAFTGKIRAQIREGKYFDVKKDLFLTFAEAMDWYLSLPDTRRQKAIKSICEIAKPIRAFFGASSIKDITPEMIQEFIDSRIALPTWMGTPRATGSINREIALIKRIFNCAEKHTKIYRNPAKIIPRLSGENVRDRVLSSEEWEAYLDKAPAWYRPIAICAYLTAMRQGEILRLKWDRVDRKGGFIRLRPEDTKTSEGRIIPIASELDGALPPRSIQKDGLVFTGHGMGAQNIRRIHQQICKNAKIADFKIHDFRHTCITNWRREGSDYLTIMRATGHKTMIMFQRYNSFNESDLRALVRKPNSHQIVTTAEKTQ